MVLGFKKYFVPPIQEGTKIHSIREDSKGRWKPGMTIHMATGTRTKYYENFKTTTCISTQRINMEYLPEQEDFKISVSDRVFNSNEAHNLAIRDGFANLHEFYKWWVPVLAKLPNLRYSGKIIHWTDYRY